MPAIRRHSPPRAGKQDNALFSHIVEDVKALNSSIDLISQKLKHIVRNEKILGKNLIVLSKKFEKTGIQNGSGKIPANLESQLNNLQKQLEQNASKIEQMSSEIESIKTDFTVVKELKSVIESINPLEFVTLDQAKDLINEKMEKSKTSKK